MPFELIHRYPFWCSGALTLAAVLLGVGLVWVQRSTDAGNVGSDAAGPVVRGDGGAIDYFGPHAERSHRTPLEQVRRLPPAARDFIGRDAVIAEVQDLLRNHAMVNIYGLPGTGKTTLAVEIASRLGAERHDCQIYFDMSRSDIEACLGNALTWLGVQQSELPPGVIARADDYRMLLGKYRPLVLIDNATPSPDLPFLLPSQPDAVVIITSWAPMTGLPGLRIVGLTQMNADESVELLARVAGRRDTPDDPAIRAVADLNGHLPLALRISAGMISERPDWSWSDIARKLTDESGGVRTEVLTSGLESVHRTFHAAYRSLEPTDAATFRLMALTPAPTSSMGLVLAALSADQRAAEDAFDRLAARHLVRKDGDRCHMHALLWSWVRELQPKTNDPQLGLARKRITSWALHTLNTTYVTWLKQTSSRVPLLGHLDHLDLVLKDLYIENRIAVAGDTTDPRDLFSGRQKTLIVGPGGSGKTTIVNHLCLTAAIARGVDPQAILPLVLFARDIRPGDQVENIQTLLLRGLRERADIDIPNDALDIALKKGNVGLAIDGLDEIGLDELRFAFLRQLHQFTADHPDIAVLITSRPHAKLKALLPDFTYAEVPSWSQVQCSEYMDRLARTTPMSTHRIIASQDVRFLPGLREMIGDPLALQLAGVHLGPLESLAGMMESFVNSVLIQREAGRQRRGSGSREDIRRALEVVAFTMQSSTTERTSLSASRLLDIIYPVMMVRGDRAETASIFRLFSERSGLFGEVGGDGLDARFAFTHTAFREYLAASYLSGRYLQGHGDASSIVRIFAQHADDPSWLSVLTATCDLGMTRYGPNFTARLLEAAHELAEPDVVVAIHNAQRARA
ncbi:hypothetical protein Lfu02_00120 [Longispora fulva]|nr:hypothetical protein Lfu02_00120 [Longispora fulva]